MEKKRVSMGGWFDLPRLGTEVWSALVRKQGVVYDKSTGFKFDAGTDLQGAVRTLRSAGVEVELTLRCFVCGKEACPGCPYLSSCDRTSVSALLPLRRPRPGEVASSGRTRRRSTRA